MPITQDKLIALIGIANKAADRLVAVRGQVEHFEDLKPATTMEEWESRFYELCEAVKVSTWLDHETVNALAEERAHFKFNHKHNTRMRDVMRNRRLRKRAELEGQKVEEEIKLYMDPFAQAKAPASVQAEEEGLDLIQTGEPDDRQELQDLFGDQLASEPTAGGSDRTGGLLPTQPIRPRFARKT